MIPSRPVESSEDRERARWIVANTGHVMNRAKPDEIAALRRRDERERKRGMALAAEELFKQADWYKKKSPNNPEAYMRIEQAGGTAATMAGPAAMSWARRRASEAGRGRKS